MSLKTNLLVAFAVVAIAITPTSLAGAGIGGPGPKVPPSGGEEEKDGPAKTDSSGKGKSSRAAAMPNPNFEAENWGANPILGLSVQDMTPFGSGWSGNKQMFWNPGASMLASTFAREFKAPGAKAISLDLTAAPDYGSIRITLFCFIDSSTTSKPVNVLPFIGQQLVYDGYALSVQRRNVSLLQGGGCTGAKVHGYKVVFQSVPTIGGRRFAGIDRIVVSNK